MLCLDTMERRQGPFIDLDDRTHKVPQLWLGDHLIANCLSGMDWRDDPVQFTICSCGVIGCSSGGYFHVRRSGDHVIFLPAFAAWEDEFSMVQYAELDLPGTAYAGFMTGPGYETLRASEPQALALDALFPLTYCEAVALWYFETPTGVLDRKFRAIAHDLAEGRDVSATTDAGLIGFDRSAILCTSAEDDEAVLDLLRRTLATVHLTPSAPVEVIGMAPNAPVTLYLDLAGFVEWPALAKQNGEWYALLSPSFGFELNRIEGN